MKVSISLLLMLSALLTVSVSYARSNGYTHTRSYSTGSTHNVRTYTKRNGTVVHSHRAGNPRSGVHCHQNVCQ